LWVDDLARCHALVPAVRADQPQQQCDGVNIYHWYIKNTSITPAEVVIEAFGCDPPADFVRAMTPETLWINLEYLSAEAWVEGCHALPSPQVRGLTKWFFFPGFSTKTGGLLREADLFARRDAWQADQQAHPALWQSLRLPEPAVQALEQGARQIFLFCYPHAPVAALLQGLMMARTPAVVLASPGAVTAAHKTLVQGSCVQLCEIAFVAQAQFDALLWGSDLNCVRGEDSMVRALWAGRPLLWHIYPQQEDAHVNKLEAWLAHAPYPASVTKLIQRWNADTACDADQVARLLSDNLAPAAWTQWENAAHHWCQTLAQRTDLASALTAFCASKQQNR